MLSEAVASVGRTISKTFCFVGRSRRLEIGYYWIASTLLAGVFGLLPANRLDWAAAVIAREAIQFFVAIPFFALFARRLHDQNRSAWWTLMLPPVVGSNVYDHLRVNFHAFDPAWPDFGFWKLALAVPVLLSLAFMLIPGDVGENRFGPDPRLTPQEPSAA